MPGHVRKPACSLCQPQPLVWPVLLQVLHAFMMICITDIFLISGSPCTIAHHCCLRKTLSDLDLCLGELDIWCCRRACVPGESDQCCCRLSMNHSETSTIPTPQLASCCEEAALQHISWLSERKLFQDSLEIIASQ